MPTPMDDKKTETDPKAHTPAYNDGFSPNTEKLSHILRFSAKAMESGLLCTRMKSWPRFWNSNRAIRPCSE